MLSSLREHQPDLIAEVRSKAFYHVLDLAARVARFDSSVLITGESGVGKEVIARHIHAGSPRLTLDAQCLQALQRHPWPGNVRELENALERAAVMSEDGRITSEGLPGDVVDGERASLEIPLTSLRPLKEVGNTYIRAVLRHTDNNRSEAAKILGIGVTTLWRRLKEMGIEAGG